MTIKMYTIEFKKNLDQTSEKTNENVKKIKGTKPSNEDFVPLWINRDPGLTCSLPSVLTLSQECTRDPKIQRKQATLADPCIGLASIPYTVGF